METFVSKVKRKVENKSTFFANLNAPCPTTPDCPAVDFELCLSGKNKKVVRALGKKVEQRELGLLNQLESPVPEKPVGL